VAAKNTDSCEIFFNI